MPLATVQIDHQSIQEVYDEVLTWLALPDTNKTQVARITGISRNTINRYIRQDRTQEPLTTNFILLVRAYEIMEKGYNDPDHEPQAKQSPELVET